LSRYEADPWARCMLKGQNCAIGAALRTRRFFMQERIEAWKTVPQFRANSLLIPLEVSIRMCTTNCSPLRSCSRFCENDSCERIRPQKFSGRCMRHQPSEAQKTSRVEFSLDLFQILEEKHRELQFNRIATGDEY
jgi:hypothetical protein